VQAPYGMNEPGERSRNSQSNAKRCDMTTAYVGRDDHMTSKPESSNAPVDVLTVIVSLRKKNHLPGIAHRNAQAAR